MSLTIIERDEAVYPMTTPMHRLHPVTLSLILTAWYGDRGLMTPHGDSPLSIAADIEGLPRPVLVINSDANSESDPFSLSGLRASLLKVDIHELSPEDAREIFDV